MVNKKEYDKWQKESKKMDKFEYPGLIQRIKNYFEQKRKKKQEELLKKQKLIKQEHEKISNELTGVAKKLYDLTGIAFYDHDGEVCNDDHIVIAGVRHVEHKRGPYSEEVKKLLRRR